MKAIPKKVRQDQLWQKVYKIVEQIYSNVDDIIAANPAEEWNTASKLRSSAGDSLFYVSQVVGSVAPEMAKYDLNNARKNLFSLQSIYTFAAKQKFFEIDPQVIIDIDQVIDQLDQRLETYKKELDKQNKEDLEPWLEKYRIWQKINK